VDGMYSTPITDSWDHCTSCDQRIFCTIWISFSDLHRSRAKLWECLV
jgi:hypothetical protein